MKNTTWFDYIIVLVCGYFVFTNTQALLQVPRDQWGLLEILMIILSLGFLVLGILRIRKIIQGGKQQKEEAEALRQRQQAQAEAQRRAEAEQEDLSWLDEDLNAPPESDAEE